MSSRVGVSSRVGCEQQGGGEQQGGVSSLPEEVDGDVQVFLQDDGKAHVLMGQNRIKYYYYIITLNNNEPLISISECINILELTV